MPTLIAFTHDGQGLTVQELVENVEAALTLAKHGEGQAFPVFHTSADRPVYVAADKVVYLRAQGGK